MAAMNLAEKIKDWRIRHEQFQAENVPSERFAICLACEHHRPKMGVWCALCGCQMKLKVHFMEAHCPIKKW
jgi:hypothetical protein